MLALSSEEIVYCTRAFLPGLHVPQRALSLQTCFVTAQQKLIVFVCPFFSVHSAIAEEGAFSGLVETFLGKKKTMNSKGK